MRTFPLFVIDSVGSHSRKVGKNNAKRSCGSEPHSNLQMQVTRLAAFYKLRDSNVAFETAEKASYLRLLPLDFGVLDFTF